MLAEAEGFEIYQRTRAKVIKFRKLIVGNGDVTGSKVVSHGIGA